MDARAVLLERELLLEGLADLKAPLRLVSAAEDTRHPAAEANASPPPRRAHGS
jgi:hypothetical protein